jgi:hypothetical protein
VSEADLQHLIGSAAEARRRIGAGQAVELAPLARLVAEMAAARERETATAGSWPVALVDELEQLVSLLEREREAVARSLSELAARGRAGRAYARKP